MTNSTLDTTKEYKVFISYSWTSPEHEEWVYNLAERLTHNGIIVKFDKWDLKEGHDKFKFMESMVQDETIDKVLMICDKGYQEKADVRVGGVGTETQIITQELYKTVEQNKFIPVIAEQGESFDSYMPIFAKTRIAINMSSDETYESGYDQLLRLIVNCPKNRRPELGKVPSYLYEEEKDHFKTKNIVRMIKNDVLKNPEHINYHIPDFFEAFKESLDQFILNYEDMKEPFNELINKIIEEMTPLRNDYIEFLSEILKSNINFNIDKIINLFEELYFYTDYSKQNTSKKCQFDHYKFFIMELFLYTVIELIDYDKFEDLNILLSSDYYIKSQFRSDTVTFPIFRFSLSSLENQYRGNNPVGVLLIQRSVFKRYNFKQKLLNVDILLYFISRIKFNDEYNSWFSSTNNYFSYNLKNIILRKLNSKRYFNTIKILFDVDEPEELITKIRNLENSRGFRYGNFLQEFEFYIKLEDIATKF